MSGANPARAGGHPPVGLMGQMRPPDPSLGGSPEGRQAGAAGEMMHERRGEDGLAGAGEARDAETEGGLDELARGLPERMRSGPGAGGKIGDHGHNSKPGSLKPSCKVGLVALARKAASRLGAAGRFLSGP